MAAFFHPRNVALIGASDRSTWSQSIFARFREYGHEGELFAVNRNGAVAHGLRGYRRVADIPAAIDTSFIYVPAEGVIGALREAADAGVRRAVVLSSGFAEAGPEGAVLQANLAAAAAELGVALLGPNSLGFANFAGHRFATAIRTRLPVRQGRLAIVSQSGAVASELAKWAYAQGIGLSFLCATGNEAQIGVAEVLDHLVDDDATDAIAVYMEGVNDPARFMAAAARSRLTAKPIVMLKLGRSEMSGALAQAHSGSLIGDDGATDAMCRRFGIARASSIEELITTADFLGRIGPINPPRVGMVSISGGACGMYADLAKMHGLATPAYAPHTQAALWEVLPAFAATLNPLDVTGVVIQKPAIWTDVIPVLLNDPGMGLIITSNNIPNTDEELRNQAAAFAAIAEGYHRGGARPVILSFSQQDITNLQTQVRETLGLEIVLPSIELGVRALAHLQRWSEGLRQEFPIAPKTSTDFNAVASEREVLAHLAAHGVPVIPAELVRSGPQAAAAAAAFGGAVALKVLSPDIPHKTEAGAVRLNVRGEEAIERAYEDMLQSVLAYAPDARIEGVTVAPMRQGGLELIVGVARDPHWGLILVVGMGGVFTEALRDTQVRLLPISATDVRGMLEGLRGANLLKGFRGAPPADMDRLARVIAAIADAALALGPELAALEVNPLWVSGEAMECLDGLAIYA